MLRLRVSELTEAHWARFAQEWRNSYKVFTKKLADDTSVPWMSVDDHHLKSLQELIAKWEMEGLWDEEETKALSLVWHSLEPWEDSARGVEMLNQRFATCTLSNGNMR
jgi:2-haloacid dehalogenase